MSVTTNRLVTLEDSAIDSDDDFQYEEVELDDPVDDIDDDDEDLESALMRVRQQAVAEQNARQVQPSVGKRPELIDDFIRNFLLKMKMTKTLDAFQTEWYEKAASGELTPEDVGVVADVYQRNQELDNQVKALRAELDKAKEIAHKARSTWDKFRKERDFHRMNHRRVVQEKGKLVTDLRRLRAHLATYEPTLKGLENKYEVSMKEKSMAKIQADRLAQRVETLENQLRQATIAGGAQAAIPGFDSPTGQAQQRSIDAKASYGTDKGKTTKSKTAAGAAAAPPSAADAALAAFQDRENPYLQNVAEPQRADKYDLRKTFKAHIAAISALALHPKKSIVATASDDNTWKMWSLPNGELILTGEGHKSWVSCIDFHPRATNLSTSSGDGTVKIWDFARSKCVATLPDHTQSVWGLAYHDSGDVLGTCSMDHTSKLWDIERLRCRTTLRGHVDSVNSIVFQPFSNSVCTASGDKTVSLWDARTGLCVQTFYGHLNAVNHAAFALRGDTIASADADGGVRVWDVRMVQERVRVDAGPHAANKVAFDRSGTILAIASDDHTVKILDVTDGSLLSALQGHDEAVQAVVFDAQSKSLITAGSDNTFRIWA